MSNNIDVRAILGVQEKPPALFFDPVGPDRYAAMDRKRITEELFEELYMRINRINNRGIPADTKQLYEDLTITFCKILHAEEATIKGRASDGTD